MRVFRDAACIRNHLNALPDGAAVGGLPEVDLSIPWSVVFVKSMDVGLVDRDGRETGKLRIVGEPLGCPDGFQDRGEKGERRQRKRDFLPSEFEV